MNERNEIKETRRVIRAFVKMFFMRGQLKVRFNGVSAGKYLKNLFILPSCSNTLEDLFMEGWLEGSFGEEKIYKIEIAPRKESNVVSVLSIDGNFEITVHNLSAVRQEKTIFNTLNELKIKEVFFGEEKYYGVNFTCTKIWNQEGSPEKYIFDFTDSNMPYYCRKPRIPYEYIVAKGNFKVISEETKCLSEKEKRAAFIFIEEHKEKIKSGEIISEGFRELNIEGAFLRLHQLCCNDDERY